MHPESEPKPGFRAIAAAFLDGCIKPSRTAFWAMLVGLAANLALAGWFFRYDTLASPTGAYLAGSTKDTYAIATHRALTIARETSDDPLLVILGSSATSTAFASESDVAAALDAATGEAWEVAILATGAQGPMEQFALLDTVLSAKANQEREVVVMLGVEASLGYWQRAKIVEMCNGVRLGLRSDWEDAAWAKIGETRKARSPYYVIENRDFVAVNGMVAMLRLLTGKPAAPKFDHYAPQEPTPLEGRLDGRTRVGRETREGHESNDGVYLDLLGDLAARLAAYPNVRLIVAPERPSPDLIAAEGIGPILDADSVRYANFARQIGATFWPMMAKGSIPQSSYYDDLHIGVPATRAAIIAELARIVASMPVGDSQS